MNIKRIITISSILFIFMLNSLAFFCRAEDDFSKAFIGDDKFRTYPYEIKRLESESAVVKADKKGNIAKVYSYNKDGKLIRIGIPSKNIILFLDYYNGDTRYILANFNLDKLSIINVVGGDFEDFDTTYEGGAGLTDIASEISTISQIVGTNEESKKKLFKSIEEYKKANKKPLSIEDFNKPIDTNHPLMKMQDMDLEYFFDAHGERMVYKVKSEKEYEVFSNHEIEDKAIQERMSNSLSDIFPVNGAVIVGSIISLIIRIILLILLIGMVLLLLAVIIKFIDNMMKKYLKCK